MKIFINMISLFMGGPKTVGFGILEGISKNNKHEWIVLLPSESGYEKYIENNSLSTKNIKIIYAKYPNILFKPVWKFYYDNLITAFYYYFKKIDLVFMTANFLSFFIRPDKQVVLQHNALYFEKYSNQFDDNRLKFIIGKLLVNYSLSFNPKIIVQLQCIKNKIIRLYKYPSEKIKVVTMIPPFRSCAIYDGDGISSILKKISDQSKKLKLFFPANFYPGKNHQILFPLAELIVKNNEDIVIFVTLSNSCRFMQEVRLRKLEKIIISLEHIEYQLIDKVYQAVDILLFPTYVESYGMPYVEAIKNSLPIITADYDFSREICGSSAVFFKQNDIESLYQAVHECADIKSYALLKEAVNFEKHRFDHDWTYVIDEIFSRQE